MRIRETRDADTDATALETARRTLDARMAGLADDGGEDARWSLASLRHVRRTLADGDVG